MASLVIAHPCALLKIYNVRRADRKVKSGAFWNVYEVEWNGTTCAVKFMHDIYKEILSKEEKQSFITANTANYSHTRFCELLTDLTILRSDTASNEGMQCGSIRMRHLQVTHTQTVASEQ